MYSRSLAPRVAAIGRFLSLIAISGVLGACSHSSDAVDVATPPTAVMAQEGAGQVVEPETIARDARMAPAGGLLVAGAAEVQNIRHLAPHTHADTDAPYMLDSGDRIRIFVYGQPNLSRIYTIDGAGFVSMPLIGAVKTRGETTFDLERAVTVQLGAKYVRDPKVSVEVAAYRPFYILGEVRTSGQYPYVNGMTVQTAVAIAGGYSERASERKVIVTRRVNGVTEKLRGNSDMPVLPGDTIHVPERYF